MHPREETSRRSVPGLQMWADSPQVPSGFILTQRAVIVEKPRLCLARCLMIRGLNDKDYQRVGQVQVRYGSENDNPFNSKDQAGMEEMRLVCS
jgi:hypothetical protein